MRIVLRDLATCRWLEFSEPVAVLAAREHADVMETLRNIESRVDEDNLWAAGFIAYEAAAGFDQACVTQESTGLPLLSFGLFRRAEELPEPELSTEPSGNSADWQLDTAQHTYMRNVERIREQIALGNTYQVNYTMRGQTRAIHNPWQLFLDIARDAPLAAYLETDEYAIVSASPELFFRLDGSALTSRPMKGTAVRGLDASDDARRHRDLLNSVKDRAENVMIADMLRNDMGRVADPGTVVAESLFDIEKYSTVWQATSTVSAATGKPVSEILAALFPCASITGAPKIASMELIAKLERSPRGIYTGTIGYIAPGRKAQFNVAIRTAHVDRRSGDAEYGVGGGIVWDSRPALEYAECLAKGRILRQRQAPADFQLLETMLWTRESGYFLLDGHLSRLSASAEYFDFDFDKEHIIEELQKLAMTLHNEHHRVRLLMDKTGETILTETALCLPTQSAAFRVCLAKRHVDTDNVFLYHKTTQRAAYENALEGVDDCDDVLLWNREGYLTESTVANVAVRLHERLYTPPIRCGLLPGVLRASLLESGELHERPIRLSELADAQEIILLNSVRKQYPARLV
ncbi:MAG: aminodeoxychorismate synthase component I [Woeseia sp.]|nr:aminodeoxychorismate synthase component I [Woeseia sp.]